MPGNPIEGARNKGRKAYKEGEKKDQNPYKHEGRTKGFHNAWKQGWEIEEAENTPT